MKKQVFLFLGVVAVLTINGGCKKSVEKVAEDFMINLITNNFWVVSSFSAGGTNLTSDFSVYEYKFNKDGSVWGQKTGATNEVGTWAGNSDAQTITSNFPSSPHPCNKLNGVWQVQKTTMTSVNANRFEGSTEYKLYLVKK